jgi:predicted Na+-dependent transporter
MCMTGVLSTVLNISTLVFAVTSMLAVGFSYTFKEIIEPLRNLRGVLVALLANFVLVPLLACAVTRLLPLDPGMEIGLILVSTAAGAPFLIKLTQIAEGDLAFAAGILVLLLVVTMAYMPVVVPLIAPDAAVSATSIAMPLVITMLLPLVIGLIVDAWNEPLTERLLPWMNKASSLSLVLLLASTFLLNFQAILGVFGTGAILAALAVIAGAFGIGYLLGGPHISKREVMGLATAQRNVAAVTVVATQAFDDANIVVMVVVTSIVSMIMLFPTAVVLRKLGAQRDKASTVRGQVRRKAPWV